jgi:two-component system chemotaxis response regulator CheB
VSYARPSIDVLFESAAYAFGAQLIGVVLTGANHDGSAGLRCVQARGGLAIVQDPQEAEVDAMPRAALKAVKADHVVTLDQLGPLLVRLSMPGQVRTGRME